jgi:hypothetical protein
MKQSSVGISDGMSLDTPYQNWSSEKLLRQLDCYNNKI